MKYLFVLLVVASFAFAVADHGCTETTVGINPQVSGTDAVSLTLVNDWATTDQVLGIDYYTPGDLVLAVNNSDDLVQAYDAGSPVGTLTLDAANTYAFGVSWNNEIDTEGYLVNDFQQSVLYFTEDFGSSWTTVAAPGGTNSRGMDHDGTDFWTTNGTGGGIYRFQPGVGQENIAIPEITDQPSGLTVFPYGSNVGVAVTAYNDHSIWFYEWDGSTLSFLGSAACPVSGIQYSMGLAYGSNGNIYWTYWNAGSVYHLAEFSFDITSLERSSWASIKSSF